MSHGGRWSSVEFCGDHYEYGDHYISIGEFLGSDGGVPKTAEQRAAFQKENAGKHQENSEKRSED